MGGLVDWWFGGLVVWGIGGLGIGGLGDWHQTSKLPNLQTSKLPMASAVQKALGVRREKLDITVRTKSFVCPAIQESHPRPLREFDADEIWSAKLRQAGLGKSHRTLRFARIIRSNARQRHKHLVLAFQL